MAIPRLDPTMPFGRVSPPDPYPARRGERVGERLAQYAQSGQLFDVRGFLIQSSKPLVLGPEDDPEFTPPQESMTALQLSVSVLIARAHRLPLGALKEAAAALLGEVAPDTKAQIVAQLRLAVRRGRVAGRLNKPAQSN